MRSQNARGRARAAVVLVAAALALLLVGFGAPLARAGASLVLGFLTGDRISLGGLSLTAHRLVVADVSATRASGAAFAARRIEIRYDLRELVLGGSRRFGLEAVVLEGPRLTLVRRADGSIDVPANLSRSSAAPGAGPARDAAAPLVFEATVRDGGVALLDPYRNLAVARRLALDHLSLRLDAVSGGLRYRGTARIADDAPARLAFAGRIDTGGFSTHRLRASAVDIRSIADYFINAPSAALARGRAAALDLRLYALPALAGTPHYHVAGWADVTGGVLRVPGISPLATGLRGRLELSDDGLLTRRLDARLGGARVLLCGGLYDRGRPAFRLAVRSQTDFATLRGLFRFSARLPLRGAVFVSTLLEGDVGAPVVATRFRAPGFSYGPYPIFDGRGRAIYHAGALDVVEARGTYGGLAVRVDGAIVLGGPAPVSDLVTALRGPAAGIPYAAQLAPQAILAATGVVAGPGLRLDARGIAHGSGGGVSLAAAFHVDAGGNGAVGPLTVARSDGSRLGGMLYFDRSENRSGFWFDARDYAYADLGRGGKLPGIDLRAPSFRGRLNGAFAGVGPPSLFRLAGRLRIRALRVGTVVFDEVTTEVAGALGNVRLGNLAARGHWGLFRGNGQFAAGRLALAGGYDGSFEQLRGFTGELGGRGSLDGPVALLIDRDRTLVQLRGTVASNATVRGLRVAAVSGTLALAGRNLRIYAANARVPGGRFAAAGSATAGYGVSLEGSTLPLATPLGSLHGGRAAAIGVVSGSGAGAIFAGGLAVGNAVLARIPVFANGDVTLRRDRLAFVRTDAEAGDALAAVAGQVTGLQTRAYAYDVAVHIPSARVAPLVAALAPDRRGIAGTMTGDLRARGGPGRGVISGDVALPEGTFDGLAFRAAAANVSVDAHGAWARAGRVTVGSTQTRFSALASGTDYALRVSSPEADLADFNNLFDAGDTLGGRGRVDAGFSKQGNVTRTDAEIAIAALRFRRFDLGDARAAWRSDGRRVTGAVDFGGLSGRLDASGVLELPAHAPLAALLARSRFDGRARLADLDLGVWLPALGYQVPIAGRLDATATVAGLLRNPAVTTVATLRGGSIGSFPVDSFVLEAASTLDHTSIRRLQLDLPAISVTGSGEFGLLPKSRVALSFHAESPNLADLSARLLGSHFPLTGTARADLLVDGSRSAPRFAGRLAAAGASVRGVAIPQARTAFVLRGRDVVLSDAQIDFAAGALALEGSVPLVIEPLGFGPAAARIALKIGARKIDLADFAPLLPASSILRGRLDGNVTVGGTAGAPRLGGGLTLAGGTVQTPYETVPLTDVAAVATFDGAAAQLQSLHAAAGGGTLDAGGSVRFADLVRPGAGATYAFVARAKTLRLELPAYGSGTIDGTLSFARPAEGLASLAGDLRLSDGTIPFGALLVAGGAGAPGLAATVGPPALLAPNVAFDLDVGTVRNVRVRSANVDIGARGDLHVGGTLAAPLLAGAFTSTGGTVTYFNTVFRLIDGTVTFAPDLGVVPTLEGRAVTHVIDPDPNTIRNLAGTADVTLTLDGPVTNLTIGLSSNPAYERQQILGLLLNAPALGASNLFGETRDQATPYGSNTTAALPPGVATFRTTTGELSVAQEAFGVANAQFTRTLLAPIETTFANAVGLSNFNVNVDYTGNVGVSARKVLGKSVNAVYGSSFGYPYRQTFGFELKPSPVTAAQLTVFDTLGQSELNGLTPINSITNAGKIGAAQPLGGTTGVSLSFQRLF